MRIGRPQQILTVDAPTVPDTLPAEPFAEDVQIETSAQR
jgi:hypothetical protein